MKVYLKWSVTCPPTDEEKTAAIKQLSKLTNNWKCEVEVEEITEERERELEQDARPCMVSEFGDVATAFWYADEGPGLSDLLAHYFDTPTV